ncbi:WD repeat-containing protein 18 [Euwallacea similis]|uniref:WD repeat-containing protein 18 n=1 Tax=Euwallacea similis TaxID=1736056 RepID=UPI00344C6C33
MENQELLLTTSQSSQQFSVSLWDYNTKNVLKLYKNGGTVPNKCLSVVGKDYILAAETSKPLLHAWPLNSQEIDKNIRLILPGPIICLAICPQNRYLAVAISTKLYVWQLSSGKLLSVQQRHFQPITCIKFSSDGEYVVVGGEDGILVVYFLANLIAIHHSLLAQSSIGQVEPVYTRNDHSMPIRDIHLGCFGRNSRIATCSADHTARLYTLATGDLLLCLVFKEQLTSILFDSPCWNLYIGTTSGLVKQFNLKSPPRTLNHFVETTKDFIGHKNKIVALALNCSNSILATGAEDNFVYTWEIKSKQILQKFEHTASISNVKFVQNYANFHVQTLKPQVVIKSLERSIEHDSEDFVVSKVQTEDIDFSDDENGMQKEVTRKKLLKENVKLRIVNAQLYRAALEISKKYNM